MNFRQNEVLILGDTHGVNYVFDLIKDLKSIDVFHIGDVGLGFYKNDHVVLGQLNALCDKNDIQLYLLRGNHDNPSFWNIPLVLSNITFVPDYSTISFPNGKRVLCVGGAVSIDRINRVPGLSWWEDEEVPLFTTPLIEHDYLFSHTTGEQFNASGKLYFDTSDPYLQKDCNDERKLVSTIIADTKVKVNIYGHFHNSEDIIVEGVRGRCVDINERFLFVA